MHAATQRRLAGETKFGPGEWAGVFLDEPIGRNTALLLHLKKCAILALAQARMPPFLLLIYTVRPAGFTSDVVFLLF